MAINPYRRGGDDVTVADGGTEASDAASARSNLNVGITARKNSGAATSIRPQVNFIEGSNVTITITDDAGDDEIEVTIAAVGDLTVAAHATTNHNNIDGVGKIVQIVDNYTTSELSTTNTVPRDNTAPQTGETGSIVSFSFTPKFSTSRIYFDGIAHLSHSGASNMYLGLFIQGGASAVSSSFERGVSFDMGFSVPLSHRFSPGSEV